MQSAMDAYHRLPMVLVINSHRVFRIVHVSLPSTSAKQSSGKANDLKTPW